ncbi:hypothetical protein DI392_07455 [Vibrio albus]|uniref:J domain-containing protein n=1 Tax=Vibrio albus TaxID=2200953 RepID=A0A2U3BB54_9VIBR|nr:tetratricopeptide repeat protein [Vibrio albus]PWI34028.1 hypothetical protein DI392_07455 [Vibrio albus]
MKGYSLRLLFPCVALLLIIILTFPYPTDAATIDSLEKRAAQDDVIAQLELARAYLSEETGNANQKQALYWYSKAAITGNSDAQYELGLLFENWYPTPSLDQAEIWYKLAAENNQPDAEAAYTHILEIQFNHQRAKQISSIQQLDKTFNETPTSQATVSSPTSQQPTVVRTDILAVSAIVFFAVLIFTGRRFIHKRNDTQSTELQGRITGQNQQLDQLKKKYRIQQKQISKMYSQLKQTQQQDQTHKLAVACALLGYTTDNLPDNKTLKLRYKKLCRIYHPDTEGSDEEMKRLNEAIKLISSYKKP